MNKVLPIVLRGAASIGLVVLAATGCSLLFPFDPLDLPEAAQDKYHCQAEVIDDLDLRTVVYNYDDTGHEGVVLSQCFVLWEDLAVDSLEDVVDAWHRWLDDAIEADGWCVVADTISCEEAGPLGEETCPAVTLPAEARDFCAEGTPCCIRSAPAEINFEDLQEAAGMNRWTPVGSTSSIEATGTLRNHCDREVSFRPRDGLLGESPGDYELFNNNCTVPEPPEDHPDGLTLSPAGTPDDFCTYQLRFTPSGDGVRRARMEFVQSDTSACTSSDMAYFRGRGRAGALSGVPEEICLGLAADGRCTIAFSWELTNDGPGIVAVESIDVSGNFELMSADSLELASGESTMVTVRWCASLAGDVDEDGSLTIVSNATEEEILVPLTRRAAGCP